MKKETLQLLFLCSALQHWPSSSPYSFSGPVLFKLWSMDQPVRLHTITGIQGGQFWSWESIFKTFIAIWQNYFMNGESNNLKFKLGYFPGGPVAKTLPSQCRGPRFEPWSRNWILQAATKNSHSVTKDPMCWD